MRTGKSARRERFETDAFPHLDALCRTALWLTLRQNAAEDLVLETMTQAYRTWHGPAPKFASKARLFRIMTRECFVTMSPRYRIDSDTHMQWLTAAEQIDDRQLTALTPIDAGDLTVLRGLSDTAVKGAVARLDIRPRLILLLFMREGFSYDDIAYITELQPTTIRAILTRLRHLIPQNLVQGAALENDANGATVATLQSIVPSHTSRQDLDASGSGWEARKIRRQARNE